MEVTALIPDPIIREVQELTHEDDIPESIVKALCDWICMKELEQIETILQKKPMNFVDG